MRVQWYLVLSENLKICSKKFKREFDGLCLNFYLPYSNLVNLLSVFNISIECVVVNILKQIIYKMTNNPSKNRIIYKFVLKEVYTLKNAQLNA